MSKAKTQTATDRLAELAEQERQAKVAHNQAEREALLARNTAEQAEQEVVRAYDGHGTVATAEKALENAETDARTAKLKAQGLGLRHQETETELRQYHGSHYAQLVASPLPRAAKPGEKMLQGVRLLLEGHGEWKAFAQEVDSHLRAAGHQPSANMRYNHELEEVCRLLTKFEGTVSPPLPHGHGINLRRQQDETAMRMRGAAA